MLSSDASCLKPELVFSDIILVCDFLSVKPYVDRNVGEQIYSNKGRHHSQGFCRLVAMGSTTLDGRNLPSVVLRTDRRGDFYRYLAEFKFGNDRKDVADLSMKAYETATTTAEAELPPTHPIRLGLALNFLVFYYEFMNSAERACHLAK
ncbi:hypothetical protein LXL04_037860 [Taraxacum kok-saghyz]